MIKLNNPAGRLQAILKTAKAQPARDNATEVWAKILGVERSDQTRLFFLLSQVMALPTTVKMLVDREPDIEHSIYLRWIPIVEAAFANQNLNAHFGTFSNGIDETTLYGIEVCSDILSRRVPDPDIPESELQSLLAEVEEIIKQVRSGTLDQELKELILGHLDAINLALNGYPITGVRPLRHAFEGVLGAVIISPDASQRAYKTPEGEWLWKIMGRIMLLLAIPGTSLQVYDLAGRMLGPSAVEQSSDEAVHSGPVSPDAKPLLPDAEET